MFGIWCLLSAACCPRAWILGSWDAWMLGCWDTWMFECLGALVSYRSSLFGICSLALSWDMAARWFGCSLPYEIFVLQLYLQFFRLFIVGNLCFRYAFFVSCIWSVLAHWFIGIGVCSCGRMWSPLCMCIVHIEMGPHTHTHCGVWCIFEAKQAVKEVFGNVAGNSRKFHISFNCCYSCN